MRIFSMLTSTVAFGMALASQAAVSTAASGTSVVIKDDIIFAERVPSQDGHYYAAVGYSCAYPEKKIYGVGPARLNRFNPGTRQVKVLLEDNGGSIRNPRVDYDAKRILFSWRKKGEEYHHLWEIDADGSNLRQITTGPWDDIEPCYLPDGGIVFCSTRAKRYVGCWYVQALTLFRCERNGSNLRMLTSSAFTENSPSVLADGRVIFTRWEYVNRPPTTIHDLWTMNSDGTAQQLFFGGLTPNPLIDAVQIPGEQGVVCIQGGHAGPEHYGHLVKISERGGPNQPQSLTYLSLPAGINGASINPVTPHLAPGETLKKDLSLVKKDGGERFRFPYPVTKSTFLVALHDHLLLYDSVTGAVRKIFYESKTGWSMVDGPCLLRPRPREPVAAGTLDMSQVTGTVFLFDVYVGRNMRGVKPGAIKKLLVLEDLPKPVVF
ncbi:MAG: hypothetical protein FJ290_13220, partial [Planctomycetes bacterium]|nr:hypothetical protein [Planctomycetota bacterium]